MNDEKIKKELILRELYYENPKTSYRSPQHLWELAREEDPDISKYFVKQWLLKQSAYTRFKKFNHPKHYRHTMVRDFNQVQMDIVFLLRYKDENDGYQYILSIIDILSRFAFAFAQKTKGGIETKENIEKVFEQYKERFGKSPKLVQFDKGTEFKNQNVYAYFKSLDITYFSTSSPKKASVVERFNRTLKSKMMRTFEGEQNHRWIDNIQNFVDNYNDTVHSSIKMKPKDVNEQNKFTVWGRLFGHLVNIKKPRYQIGDRVRILNFDYQHRDMQLGAYFSKKFEIRDEKGRKKQRPVAVSAKNKPPFSEEVFEITNVLLGDPNVYKLYSKEAEENGYDADIMGIFYEQELSFVSQ